MKQKLAIAVLMIVSLVLGAVLIWERKKNEDRVREDTSKIIQYSNEWTQVSHQFEEQKGVNEELLKKLDTSKQETTNLVAALNEEKAAKAKVEADAQKAAQQAAQLAQEELAKKDAKIAEMEGQVAEQDKRLAQLDTQLGTLNKKIADTEKELATTKENREFLLTELKRMQVEKTKLEAQFNDLALLRDQVRKMKDELAFARRVEWLRNGVYNSGSTGKGGATKLMQGFATQGSRTNYDLNAEFNSDGTVKINPTPPRTNAPPK